MASDVLAKSSSVPSPQFGMLTSMSQLGLSCPSGGRWFVCQGNATQFMGCCKSDPCKDGAGVCPKANLTQASFSADLFDDIPPQSCDHPKGPQLWWTCKGNNPPFLGCCAKNPCAAKECKQADLIPARLSDNATQAAIFVTTAAPPPPTTTPDPIVAPIIAAPASHGLHPGAIAGIVIGALALISLVVFLLVWKLGWRLRHEDRESRVIAEFPATYIPNALPDMSLHKGDGYNKADDSYPTSFISHVTPDGAAGTHRRTPSDPSDFPMPLMMSGERQGPYARISGAEVSPKHSPRPGLTPESPNAVAGLGGDSRLSDASAAAAAPVSGASTPQYPSRQHSPHRYSQQFFDRPMSEVQETSPLTGRAGPEQPPKWVPYRPT